MKINQIVKKHMVLLKQKGRRIIVPCCRLFSHAFRLNVKQLLKTKC